MESLLNSVWVLLAAGALLAWRRQIPACRDHARRLVALLCVLLLIFPVISATDDLHPVTQAVEEPSKRNQKAVTANKSQATHIGHASPALPVTSFAASPLLRSVEWLQAAPAPAAKTGERVAECGRAPPSSALI
jgi:hypothetical protein